MEEFETDYTYIAKKMEITETCECPKNMFCGICFWKGIQLSPENAVNHKCKNCMSMTMNFKNVVKVSSDKFIKIELLCCTSCIWWDWFHHQRQEIAANNNVSFVYLRKKN